MSFSQTPYFFIRVIENRDSFHLHNRIVGYLLGHRTCFTRANTLDKNETIIGDERRGRSMDRFDESRYERLIRRSCGTFSSGKRREGWRDRQHFRYLTRLLYYLWGRKFERWAQLPWAEQSGLSSLPGQFRPVSRSPPPDPCRSSIVKLTVSLRNRSSERFSSNYRNACARTIPSLFHDQEEDRLRDRLNSWSDRIYRSRVDPFSFHQRRFLSFNRASASRFWA